MVLRRFRAVGSTGPFLGSTVGGSVSLVRVGTGAVSTSLDPLSIGFCKEQFMPLLEFLHCIAMIPVLFIATVLITALTVALVMVLYGRT